jgi:hypothetical protein
MKFEALSNVARAVKKVERPLAGPVPTSLKVSTTMPDPGSGAGFVKWNRKALDDESQQVVRTIVRRGYVFNVPVMSGAEFRRRTPHEADDDLTSPRPMIRGANTAAEDARTILRTAVEHHPSPPQQATSELADDKGLTHRPRRWAWMAALSALLVAASAVVAEFRRASPTRGAASTASDYTKVTNFTDSAFSPALSPDGRMVTFVRGEAMTVGGEGDIFVKLLPDGEPVQLTHDGGMKMSPTFTPGGDRVAYRVPPLMTDPKNWSTWTVSVFGRDSRLLFNNASALTWVPGAAPPRVLFSEVDAGTHMSIVTAAENRTDRHLVYSPAEADAMAHRSFVSPDGSHLLVVEMEDGWRPCWLVPRSVPSGAVTLFFQGCR